LGRGGILNRQINIPHRECKDGLSRPENPKYKGALHEVPPYSHLKILIFIGVFEKKIPSLQHMIKQQEDFFRSNQSQIIVPTCLKTPVYN